MSGMGSVGSVNNTVTDNTSNTIKGLNNVMYHFDQALLFIPPLISLIAQSICAGIIEKEDAGSGKLFAAKLGMATFKVVTAITALPAVIYGIAKSILLTLINSVTLGSCNRLKEYATESANLTVIQLMSGTLYSKSGIDTTIRISTGTEEFLVEIS